MAAYYIGLAVSATMFPLKGGIEMTPATPEEIRLHLEKGELISGLNPSHQNTIDVIRRKFDLDIPIPEKAPKISLAPGDCLYVIQAQLPRLAEGETHSQETVENAPISFRRWTLRA